jgi:hypothetical protein
MESWKGRYHTEDLGAEEDNIKISLSENGWESVDWFHLVQDMNR